MVFCDAWRQCPSAVNRQLIARALRRAFVGEWFCHEDGETLILSVQVWYSRWRTSARIDETYKANYEARLAGRWPIRPPLGSTLDGALRLAYEGPGP